MEEAFNETSLDRHAEMRELRQESVLIPQMATSYKMFLFKILLVIVFNDLRLRD